VSSRDTSILRVLIAGLLVCAGACTGDPEHAVLVRAFAASDEALLEGTGIRLDAWLLETGVRETAPPTALDRDVPASGSFRVAVVLTGPAEVRVRIEAEGAGGLYAATRCWVVVGVKRVDVMLTGPLGDLADPDGDGWPTVDSCQPRQGGAGCEGLCPDDLVRDCRPEDPAGHPGAEDTCGDPFDQDCDGGPAPCGDDDGDGVPRCPAGVEVGCDCDDSNPEVGPGVDEGPGSENCENGLDDDCDGVDTLCDRDGDGVPRCPDVLSAPEGCDCNDGDPDVHPGASETPGGECNGRDDNCNDQVDEDPACLGDDLDLDGSDFAEDCNDCSAAMAPGGAELCGDRVDGACELGGTDDGQPLEDGADACDPDDADDDGFIAATSGGTDCDDEAPDIHPGAPDACEDGIDAGCSGGDSSCATDGDDDGWNEDNDCDDGDATRAPGTEDVCDGRDDDCDGRNDEDLAAGTGCVLVGEVWTIVDFATDLVHCGHCRGSCNTGCDGSLCRADACLDGACTCSGGEACDGDRNDFCCPGAGCRDLQGDITSCGGCGVACPTGECNSATCEDGTCGVQPAVDGAGCSSGRVCCGGACTGECAPAAVEPRTCGNCGTQSHTCGAGCAWGAWGACAGEGTCAPGQVESTSCGNCGTRQRSCGQDCRWGAWSNCAGEGACQVGTTRQDPCRQCGSQQQSCSAACQWQDVGNCDDSPPSSTCNDGDPCTTDACDSGGDCTYDGCTGGTTCCPGLGCTECCGNDVSDCGSEPLCADWECVNGACSPVYEPRNRDPEGECSGNRCCTGGSSCQNTEQNC
jgi:hypothetical protein